MLEATLRRETEKKYFHETETRACNKFTLFFTSWLIKKLDRSIRSDVPLPRKGDLE